MFGIAKHQPMTFDATHALAEKLGSMDHEVAIAREAMKTALSPSNGLSENQAWAAAMWADASLEMIR